MSFIILWWLEAQAGEHIGRKWVKFEIEETESKLKVEWILVEGLEKKRGWHSGFMLGQLKGKNKVDGYFTVGLRFALVWEGH